MQAKSLVHFEAIGVCLVKKHLNAAFVRYLVNPLHNVERGIKTVSYKIDSGLNSQQMKIYCPCCGNKLRAFIEGDYRQHPELYNTLRYEHTRQDVLCPVCRSMPRHRILAAWCQEHLEVMRTSQILYFAPEKCMMVWMKRNKVRCTTADIVARADLKIDIQDSGLPVESYDIIICNHVLEHVDDFRKALKEIHRILRTDGMFICSFPVDLNVESILEEEKPLSSEERLRRFGHNDHRRIFGMQAKQFFLEAGFSVVLIKGENCPAEILPVVGPADYDINYLLCCKKQKVEKI